ncbi:hypothetical protein BZL30_1492 [Mycobacterium kansasii]|uniref:Uncharacterized protein n=1 Tax=Mycobacterium kansasii TaxID=1768 RepID=A0A1V3XSH4_MYCKA|nr:hypothetical protein BZL30_1492 [Mycobacterium kansasii]
MPHFGEGVEERIERFDVRSVDCSELDTVRRCQSRCSRGVHTDACPVAGGP